MASIQRTVSLSTGYVAVRTELNCSSENCRSLCRKCLAFHLFIFPVLSWEHVYVMVIGGVCVLLVSLLGVAILMLPCCSVYPYPDRAPVTIL